MVPPPRLPSPMRFEKELRRWHTSDWGKMNWERARECIVCGVPLQEMGSRSVNPVPSVASLPLSVASGFAQQSRGDVALKLSSAVSQLKTMTATGQNALVLTRNNLINFLCPPRVAEFPLHISSQESQPCVWTRHLIQPHLPNSWLWQRGLGGISLWILQGEKSCLPNLLLQNQIS